ncbi:HVO_0758 family zinc finger protein [Haladaptatus pallidirubidus]|uniref:HVO_0758 family zinc finger protein n=1 Tax=Haladaptatus pallidirubidus TaxID=1008152 RepID=UPI0026E53C58|nr:HVO_0758 family zinc finger protein [Haladaptatus pallidirubidus]
MQSVRSGLRKGKVEKDTYGRLSCSTCRKSLTTQNDPDEIFSVRSCPECENQWKVI